MDEYKYIRICKIGSESSTAEGKGHKVWVLLLHEQMVTWQTRQAQTPPHTEV